MTPNELIRGYGDRELAAIIDDIMTLHQDGQVGTGPFREFKSKIEREGISVHTSQMVAENVALFEATRRWVQVYKAEQNPSDEATLTISKVSTMEGEEMQVMVVMGGKHIRLAMSLLDYARASTGEAHIPVEVRRNRSKKA